MWFTVFLLNIDSFAVTYPSILVTGCSIYVSTNNSTFVSAVTKFDDGKKYKTIFEKSEMYFYKTRNSLCQIMSEL